MFHRLKSVLHHEEERTEASDFCDLSQSQSVFEVLDGMQVRQIHLFPVHVQTLFLSVPLSGKQLVDGSDNRFLIQRESIQFQQSGFIFRCSSIKGSEGTVHSDTDASGGFPRLSGNRSGRLLAAVQAGCDRNQADHQE